MRHILVLWDVEVISPSTPLRSALFLQVINTRPAASWRVSFHLLQSVWDIGVGEKEALWSSATQCLNTGAISMFARPGGRQQVSTPQTPPPPRGGSPRSDSVARRQITSPPPNLWNVALESLWVITNNDPAASVGKGTIDFLSIPKPENMTLASQGWMCHRFWNEISIFGEWLRQFIVQVFAK